MRKTLILFLFLVGAIAHLAHADSMNFGPGRPLVSVCDVSSVKTASAVISTSKAAFYGILIKTDGTNDITLNAYNGTDATGTKVFPTDMTISGTSKTFAVSMEPAIPCTAGLYVAISVAGSGTASYVVYYEN